MGGYSNSPLLTSPSPYASQDALYSRNQSSLLTNHNARENCPIPKKTYINFDKDTAAKMFGYRIRFEKDEMTEYKGHGHPPTYS